MKYLKTSPDQNNPLSSLRMKPVKESAPLRSEKEVEGPILQNSKTWQFLQLLGADFWEVDATKHLSVTKWGFQWKGGRDSVNEEFGKDFYRKQFSEEVWAVQRTAGLWRCESCCPHPLPKNQLLIIAHFNIKTWVVNSHSWRDFCKFGPALPSPLFFFLPKLAKCWTILAAVHSEMVWVWVSHSQTHTHTNPGRTA